MENKTKTMCQMENKAMKIKLYVERKGEKKSDERIDKQS